jgi:ubiquinone/menaquinone biosynthesis C-methylase UbiE
MDQLPAFRKPDRYKASSYRSYNGRMVSRYDTWPYAKYGPLVDGAMIDALGPDFASLRILDVGCATGRLLVRLAEAGATHLCGVDLAPRIVEVAAAKLSKATPPVDLRTADAEDRLPSDDDTFDAATLSAVLHHFFRPLEALVEIRRVLRPGGRLIVLDACFFPAVRQILNLAFRLVPHDGDYHFYSPRAAARLLAAAGFDVRYVRRSGCGAFLAEAVKPARASGDPGRTCSPRQSPRLNRRSTSGWWR